MSLADIRTAVYDLMQVTSPSSLDDRFLLASLNAIRKDAERKRDWVASAGVGYLTVEPTTGTLLAETLAAYTVGSGPSGEDAVDVKKVRWARTYDSATWVPATLRERSTYEALLVRSDRISGALYNIEDPSGWSEGQCDTQNLLLQDGLTLYSLRDAAVDVRLHVYAWLPTYDDFDADDDFLITHGFDYFQWAACLWRNKRKANFVPRNEGSLTEDTLKEERQNAWDSLIAWDADLTNTNNEILS